MREKGFDYPAAADWCREVLGTEPFCAQPTNDNVANFRGKWVYRTDTGEPFLRVMRYDKLVDGEIKKSYPQSHWKHGQWQSGKPEGAKLPYRLPELLAASIGALVF